MGNKESQIMISVAPEHMQDKHYNVSLFALGNTCGYIDKNVNKRVVEKTELRERAKQELGINTRQLKTIMETFVDLKLIQEDKDYYYWNPVLSHFVKLYIPTVKYCLDSLSPLSFKVYCYLSSKISIHKAYHYSTNYFFSTTELLKACGYAKNARNVNMMDNILNTLEELKLIEYNHDLVGRPGKHGLYKELYAVYERSPVQQRALEDTKVEVRASLQSGDSLFLK